MKQKELRVKIPETLYKQFKHACIDKSLSAPKQIIELMRHFVEVFEVNKQHIKE